MSEFIDYTGEMGPLAISDSDVERILRGLAPEGPGLSGLVAVIDELRAERAPHIKNKVASRHIAMAATAAGEAHAARTADFEVVETRPAGPSRERVWQLIPRLGTSLATLVLFIGLTGIAVASDDAIPGDTLHGFDLALEKIGVGAGGAEERIAEARELANGGMPVEALDYVSSALGNDQDEASDALRAASQRIKDNRAEQGLASADHEEVARMLEWMANEDQRGEDFGRMVAEHARELGAGRPQDADAPGADAPSRAGGGKAQGKGNGGGNGKGR